MVKRMILLKTPLHFYVLKITLLFTPLNDRTWYTNLLFPRTRATHGLIVRYWWNLGHLIHHSVEISMRSVYRTLTFFKILSKGLMPWKRCNSLSLGIHIHTNKVILCWDIVLIFIFGLLCFGIFVLFFYKFVYDNH